MIRLYNSQDSGNSYKIRLLLTQLQIPFERIDIDLLASETAQPRFRVRNPLGQTPFVELDVMVPGLGQADAEALTHDAHKVCPYSNATKGNIEVKLVVHGAGK